MYLYLIFILFILLSFYFFYKKNKSLESFDTINPIYNNDIYLEDFKFNRVPLNINISYNSQNSINKLNNDSDKYDLNKNGKKIGVNLNNNLVNEDDKITNYSNYQFPKSNDWINEEIQNLDNSVIFKETSESIDSFDKCNNECSYICKPLSSNNNINKYFTCYNNKCKNTIDSCKKYCEYSPENELYC